MAKAKKKSAKAQKSKRSRATAEDTALGLKGVLFKPERMEYIRANRDKKLPDCVFCDQSKLPSSVESYKVYDGEHTMVMLNKYPYNLGHLLVLPRRHEGKLEELGGHETSEMMTVVQECIRIIKATMRCENFNIGINLGKGAGAGIPQHLHLHIVPRWDGDTNFFPLIAKTKSLPGDMPSVFNLLRPHFEKLEKARVK